MLIFRLFSTIITLLVIERIAIEPYQATHIFDKKKHLLTVDAFLLSLMVPHTVE